MSENTLCQMNEAPTDFKTLEAASEGVDSGRLEVNRQSNLLVELDLTLTEFKHRLLWRNFVGQEVSVRIRRDQCKEVSHRLSNSTHGRKYLYISLLVVISNDKERHFDWLLQLALDVLSRDEVEPTLGKWHLR